MSGKRGPFILGIDLGGTKILSAVLDAEGGMLARDHSVTPAAKGPEAVIQAIVESVRRALDQSGLTTSEIAAIGIGAPGLSNPETGILYTSPNLPGWRDIPLKGVVEKEFGRRSFLINDANAAALGEFHFGAGQGTRQFIYITVSTGIGGGIVLDGKVFTGSTGVAGEVGHMTIDVEGPPCNCGNRGCWEALASGTALAREARARISQGSPTLILEQAGGDANKVTAHSVHAAAEQGDALARELVARTGYYLGVGLANLVNIFNPEMIAIGGGVVHMGDMLLEPAYKTAEQRAFQQAYKMVRFRVARLGRNSGVLGAAAFARQQVTAAL